MAKLKTVKQQKFAIIQAGVVGQMFDEDPSLPAAIDVRDVSRVPGIASGWFALPDGRYAPSKPLTAEDIKQRAQARLRGTDHVVVSHFEAGLPLSPAWKGYRAELRRIVKGGAATELPQQPEIPAEL